MTGEQFARWRDRLGLRQEDVALLFNVSERTIINYEKGDSPVPFTTYVACMACEDWPRLRQQIPYIIAKRSRKS